ncbi:uncharacterized methyltransferase C25B8.09-like [Orbicella faveolata]|uniref:uncharacterized methyltransferase C25B8.09-like n=1 Tax=Orbicella faveolata TaxID=48498 RepID=UPI0009E5EA66|nr:uncharacterized methyltransferase C25B8.09-like [Orbicella faveolata]
MSQQNQILPGLVQRGFVGASHYENTRQDYPVEAVEFFLNNLAVNEIVTRDRPFAILEVGCGTGKFTRVMLKILELKEVKDIKVIASEPHQNMYEEFKVVMPDTEIIQCSAEKIPLPDASVDVVIAAQSFHWFANRAAVEEIHRVLAPSGSFGMIWSIEDTSVPWVKDLYEFMWPIIEQKSIVFPYQESWKTLFGGLCQQLFRAPKENLSFRHRFPFSVEKAYEFFSSYSVIAGGSEQTKKAFKKSFDNAMEKHFKGNGIPLHHISFQIYMYWCTKTTSN